MWTLEKARVAVEMWNKGELTKEIVKKTGEKDYQIYALMAVIREKRPQLTRTAKRRRTAYLAELVSKI